MEFDDKAALRKALRLFLSVDIAGSTAFKAASPDKVQPWLPALFQFFNEFPIRLNSEYQQGKLAPPRLWKTLGDEMVFVTEIKEYLDIKVHLTRFIATQVYYRTNIKDAHSKLDLKGAAWLAGFPVHNSVLHLPSLSAAASKAEDYIGPSLDIGFRIAKYATPRKFGLSLETAFLLTTMGRSDPDVAVCVDEGDELKGVLGGVPYPRIWTPVTNATEQELWDLEEKLLCKGVEQNERDINRFCKLFIETYKRPLFLPFIEGKDSCGKPPDDYDRQYEEVVKMQRDLSTPLAKKEPKAGPKRTKPKEIESKIAAIAKTILTEAQATDSANVTPKPAAKKRHVGRRKGHTS